MPYKGITGKLTVVNKTDGKDQESKVAYISNWSVEETRDAVEITQLGPRVRRVRRIFPTARKKRCATQW